MLFQLKKEAEQEFKEAKQEAILKASKQIQQVLLQISLSRHDLIFLGDEWIVVLCGLVAEQAEATKDAAEGALRLLTPKDSDAKKSDDTAAEAETAMAIAAAIGSSDNMGAVSLDSDKSSVVDSDAARDVIAKVRPVRVLS